MFCSNRAARSAVPPVPDKGHSCTQVEEVFHTSAQAIANPQKASKGSSDSVGAQGKQQRKGEERQNRRLAKIPENRAKVGRKLPLDGRQAGRQSKYLGSNEVDGDQRHLMPIASLTAQTKASTAFFSAAVAAAAVAVAAAHAAAAATRHKNIERDDQRSAAVRREGLKKSLSLGQGERGERPAAAAAAAAAAPATASRARRYLRPKADSVLDPRTN